ncbi:MAG: hypothetical protein R3F60_20845 [bacterium]
MIRVFLADDRAVVRMGLRALLATAPDIEVVGRPAMGGRSCRRPRPTTGRRTSWCSTCAAAGQRHRGAHPPGEARPTLRVLVLSMYAESSTPTTWPGWGRRATWPRTDPRRSC